jgi:hypothetical protein
MKFAVTMLLSLAATLSTSTDTQAQEPTTRAETLLVEREEKAKKLAPATPNRVERT